LSSIGDRGDVTQELGSNAARRKGAALVLVVASALCLVGAFRLPFMHSEFALDLPAWVPDMMVGRIRLWLIDKGRIAVGDHYLWGVIRKLFAAREYLVGWAILLFSVVFPVAKISLCLVLASGASLLSVRTRHRVHRALSVAGKWSMADVFIVGMVIVFFKAEGFHYNFTAQPGIYYYAAAAVLSSLAVSLVQGTIEEGRGGSA
jgi:paraquat-inducible protein A